MRLLFFALLLSLISGLVRNDPGVSVSDDVCETFLCPDLRAALPRDLVIGRYPADRFWLNSTIVIGNTGAGPLEVRPRVPEGAMSVEEVTAFQVLRSREGERMEVEVGAVAFHPGHQHFHVGSVMSLHLLRPLDASDLSAGPDWSQEDAVQHKVTFCFTDTDNLLDGEDSETGNRLGAWYQGCQAATDVQGISPGYGDNYPYFLPGNGIPLEQALVPSGDYFLVAEVNDELLYREEASNANRGEVNNNVAYRSIHLQWDEQGKPSVSETQPRTFVSDSAQDAEGGDWPGLAARRTWYFGLGIACDSSCPNECCVSPNPEDITRDDVIDISDLSILLLSWCSAPCYKSADFNADNAVDVKDLARLLLKWTT